MISLRPTRIRRVCHRRSERQSSAGHFTLLDHYRFGTNRSESPKARLIFGRGTGQQQPRPFRESDGGQIPLTEIGATAGMGVKDGHDDQAIVCRICLGARNLMIGDLKPVECPGRPRGRSDIRNPDGVAGAPTQQQAARFVRQGRIACRRKPREHVDRKDDQRDPSSGLLGLEAETPSKNHRRRY